MEYEKTRGTRGAKKYADSKQAGFSGDGRNMRGPKKTPPGYYDYFIFGRIERDHRTLTALDHQQPGEKGSGYHVFPMEKPKRMTGPLALGA